MKISTTPAKIATVLLACVIGFSSCRKKEKEEIIKEEEDTEQVSANDNNVAEGIASDIDLMGSQVSENGTLSSFKGSGSTALAEDLGLASACATVSGIGTKTITVNFGSTGCMGTDGRMRTGQLIYDFSASSPSTAVYYRNPGFSMKVTSVNYVVDGHQVNILNKTISNITPTTIPAGPNPGTNLTWSISANISIVKPNNTTISWTCNRTKELFNTNNASCYQGQNSPIVWSQAVIKLNGTSNGTNAQGEIFTASATNLIRNMVCTPDPNRPGRHPFISGTMSYSPGIRPTRTIDFGSVNSCDLNATLSIGNQTFAIVLP